MHVRVHARTKGSSAKSAVQMVLLAYYLRKMPANTDIRRHLSCTDSGFSSYTKWYTTTAIFVAKDLLIRDKHASRASRRNGTRIGTGMSVRNSRLERTTIALWLTALLTRRRTARGRIILSSWSSKHGTQPSGLTCRACGNQSSCIRVHFAVRWLESRRQAWSPIARHHKLSFQARHQRICTERLDEQTDQPSRRPNRGHDKALRRCTSGQSTNQLRL